MARSQQDWFGASTEIFRYRVGFLTICMDQRLLVQFGTLSDVADELESHHLRRLGSQISAKYPVLLAHFPHIEVGQRDRIHWHMRHLFVFEVYLAAVTQHLRLAKQVHVGRHMPVRCHQEMVVTPRALEPRVHSQLPI